MSEFCRIFQALGNLTLFFWTTLRTDCVIDCPQLVNLEINYCTTKTGKSIVTSNSGQIMVLAPKILNFSAVGIFPIKSGVFELENVKIQLSDITDVKTLAPTKKILYDLVTKMFTGLCGAKILSLDLKTIKALSALFEILVSSYSPFVNLKYVKVPHGFEESSMSTYLKWYLLGACSKATIVATLPQHKIVIRQGSWFEPLREAEGELAGLVSNPPYIPSEQISGLQAEVGKHEPRLALDGGEDGMGDLLHLCTGAASMLRPGGYFAFETNGEDQCKFLLNYMETKTKGVFYDLKVVSDFAGIQRFVTGFKVK
ncbi:uncharacterized protein LOC141693134 [Apium graveolens]|uniref:uncharacterized protein LOC141693134 n=1 Tax=Apium graveolens TaxID=4045 RepID=UPI003D7A5628